jgi:hypothetical protein
MRAQFFLYLLLFLVGLVVAYFLFMVLRAVYVTIMEVKTGRELDRLADEFSERREEQLRESQQRLDNGCDHDFGDDGGALPPNVCRKCGLARQRPPGDCDHHWNRVAGIIPQSACSKCGERFSGVPGAL